MPQVRIHAHAKVNLALALAAPEPPGSERAGWHRICTWMHAIDLADEVLVEPLAAGSASTWSARWAPDAPRAGLVDWPVHKDLAWRALRAVEGRVGRRLPTRLVLTKRIPTGAGLGGGSSDAAAALVGLDRAWGLGLGLGTLRELGATLGSDVPFFLDDDHPPRPAVVRGFGESIERTPRVAGRLLLLLPGFGCPTAAVYRAFDRLLAQRAGHAFAEARVADLAQHRPLDAAGLFNDLADPAGTVRPELARLQRASAGTLGCPVHITGSGSAMFAVVEPRDADQTTAGPRGSLPGVVPHIAQFV